MLVAKTGQEIFSNILVKQEHSALISGSFNGGNILSIWI
jgi:hypothetical protein